MVHSSVLLFQLVHLVNAKFSILWRFWVHYKWIMTTSKRKKKVLNLSQSLYRDSQLFFSPSFPPGSSSLSFLSVPLAVRASAFLRGNYLYGQCQLIIDLVITCFPLRVGQLIYKANAKGEVS